MVRVGWEGREWEGEGRQRINVLKSVKLQCDVRMGVWMGVMGV